MAEKASAGGLKPILKGLAFLFTLALAVSALRWAGHEGLLTDPAWFAAHIRGQGATGVALYLLLTAGLTGLGVPRQFLCFVGGFVFGAWWGTVLGALGTGLGCAVSLWFARYFARDFVLHRFGRRVGRIDGFLKRAPFRMALIIRFFPVGHNLTTNVLAGVSSIAAWPFILGSLLGYVPQSAVFALMGGGLQINSRLQLAVSVLLFVAATWLGVVMYRRHRAEARGVVENGNG